jgi:uncharacterized membrane protein YfhO
VSESQAREPVSIEHFDPNRIELSAEAAAPGLLVVSEVYYPGWAARVNGVDVPMVEVDGVLRGVVLPAGQAQIELTYLPRSVSGGVLISIGAWLVWLIMLIIGGRRRERVQP